MLSAFGDPSTKKGEKVHDLEANVATDDDVHVTTPTTGRLRGLSLDAETKPPSLSLPSRFKGMNKAKMKRLTTK